MKLRTKARDCPDIDGACNPFTSKVVIPPQLPAPFYRGPSDIDGKMIWKIAPLYPDE